MEDWLVKFARIVDCGSYTKAAAELHVSQPSLSVMVASLERALGAPLLVKRSRPLKLTEAGQHAYAAAKEMRVTSDNLALHLAALTGNQRPVAIGMTDSVAEGLFRDATVLDRLESQAHVSVVVQNSRLLSAAVARDELDTAFVVAPEDWRLSGVQAELIGYEPMVLVCRVDMSARCHAAMARGHLDHFISYDQPSFTSRLIVTALHQQGVHPEAVFYSTSPEVILRLVLLGRGAAVLPYMRVAPLLADGSLHRLSPAGSDGAYNIARPVAQITRQRRRLPSSLTYVRHQVTTMLQELADDASQPD